MEQKIPLHTVFSITIGDEHGAPAPPQKPRAIVSEVSYHKEHILASLAAKTLTDGILTPQALFDINGLQGTLEVQLKRNLNLDISNQGITSLEGFDALDVQIRHLNASGNALFFEQLVDFMIKGLDLSHNDIGDEIIWNFLSILAGRDQEQKPDPSESEHIIPVQPDHAQMENENQIPLDLQQMDILDDKFLEIVEEPQEQPDAVGDKVVKPFSSQLSQQMNYGCVEADSIDFLMNCPVGVHVEGSADSQRLKSAKTDRQSMNSESGVGSLDVFVPPKKDRIAIEKEDLQMEQRINTSRVVVENAEPAPLKDAQEELSGASVDSDHPPEKEAPASAVGANEAERGQFDGMALAPQVQVTLDDMNSLIGTVSQNRALLQQQFRLFSSLDELNLSNNPCGNPMLLSSVMNLFPNLNHVIMNGINLIQMDVEIEPVFQVRRLSFSNCVVTKTSLQMLAVLFPNIEYISLQHVECEPQIISSLRLFNQLQEIDLTDSEQFRDLGLLRAFVRNSGLNQLNLINCQRSVEKNLKSLSTVNPFVYFHIDASNRIMNDSHNLVANPISSKYFKTSRIVSVKLFEQPREMGSRLQYGKLNGKMELPRQLGSQLKTQALPKPAGRVTTESQTSRVELVEGFAKYISQERAKAAYQDNEIIQGATEWYLRHHSEEGQKAKALKAKNPTGAGATSGYFLTELSQQKEQGTAKITSLFSKDTYQKTLISLDIDGGPVTEQQLLIHPLDFKGLGMLRHGEKSNIKQLYIALRNVLEFPSSASIRISDEEMLASLLAEYG